MNIGDQVRCFWSMRSSKYTAHCTPALVGDKGTITRINESRDVTIVDFRTQAGLRCAHIQNLVLISERAKA